MEILKTQLIITTIVLAIAVVTLIVLFVLYIRKARLLDHAITLLSLAIVNKEADPFEEFETGPEQRNIPDHK